MIRPTFLAFETAKQALSVSQAGLDTVGHNISNANTPGFTRQRVDQVSISLNGTSSKYQVFNSPKAGLGASINAISQIRDPYLDNRYRAEATNNGELGAKLEGLTDINNIFDEIMTTGLHSKFGDLVNALDIFAQQADSKELASVMRSTANELVQMLNKNASQLVEAREMQTADLKTTVSEDVNDILRQIAELNVKIKEDNFYGNPANDLNDTRNMLIDRLSEYVDINIVRTPQTISKDNIVETLSIELKDSGSPPVMLVDGRSYNNLSVSVNPDTGNVAINLVDGISGQALPNGDITGKLYKGAIKGYVDIINGSGPNAATGESTFKGIPYYQNALDEFAQKLAEVFNRINNISEEEAKESGDPPLLRSTDGYKNLFTPQSLTIKEPKPAWMDAITPAALEFSGKNYELTFDYDSVTGGMTATDANGRVYTGTQQSNGDIVFTYEEMDLTDPNEVIGTVVAFTVSTTGVTPNDTTDVTIDANITAGNISIASSWLDDPLYITTTKKNPVTEVKAELTLYGTSNPAWLRSVSNGPDGVQVADGNYDFTIDASVDPPTISAVINGVTCTGVYKKDSTIELVGQFVDNDPSSPTFGSMIDKTAMIIQTNSKDAYASGSTGTYKFTANIKNITGAAADNLNKLKVAVKNPNAYHSIGTNENFQEFLISFQKDMSLDKSLTQSLLDSSTTVISGYADRRDAVSAVSIDEEGINMMTYQNYYNAAARYMTALDEALDKIINGMGNVGR